MKKFLFILFGLFVVAGAFAAGENVPTSKSYVDSKLGEKQDIIPANDGAARVLTNTGTTGEYGTKDIYDSTASYGGQSKSLIDAVTMNTAVQNAIDTEFVCIEWVDPNDHTSDCLLMDIRGAAPRRSPNLFDVSKIQSRNPSANWPGYVTNNGDGSITISETYNVPVGIMSELMPEVVAGETYTLSYKITHNRKYILFGKRDENNTIINYTWRSGTSMTMPEGVQNSKVNFYTDPSGTPATIWDIQVERGTVATPYQPYGNIYTPAGN